MKFVLVKSLKKQTQEFHLLHWRQMKKSFQLAYLIALRAEAPVKVRANERLICHRMQKDQDFEYAHQ